MINKFLFPRGGSETYTLQLGDYLNNNGHEVQYFGMDSVDRIVGNNVNSYVEEIDFNNCSTIKKLLYSFKTIYSFEARKKIRRVLDDFCPNVCHLNNFNYQLTPSIIDEINKWKKETNNNCKILYTAHDFQLICPSHTVYDSNNKEHCTSCINGKYGNCLKKNCIHNNKLKSLLGTVESFYWHKVRNIYKNFDYIICPSSFTKSLLDNNNELKDKTVVIHNFINKIDSKEIKDENLELPEKYILYFGSYTEGKGVLDLLDVCKKTPKINYVFAGKGELEEEINKTSNIINLGFCTGNKLNYLIKKAYLVVCPSKLLETFGLTNAEAINMGTPVISSGMGGSREIINNGNGITYDSTNNDSLLKIIDELWNDEKQVKDIRKTITNTNLVDIEKYVRRYETLINNSFHLRKLRIDDAEKMLEWMKDPSVVSEMGTDFSIKTLDDCISFIKNSFTDNNINYAIVNKNDEYLGTVSIKNINKDCGEFAITIRKCAMGTGASVFAMREMIRIGFNDFKLKYIYWYVKKTNTRAINFYDKNGYKKVEGNVIKSIRGLSMINFDEYYWYMVM